MLSLGQRFVAMGSLAFIVGVSFFVSPLLSMLMLPVSIVLAIMLFKL